MTNDYYSRYADTYDRLQPLKIEMYDFYHELALDFLPFEVHQGFRLLDLGSGTGTFLSRVIERYPNAECVALEYSSEMLEFVKTKTLQSADRVELSQRDLNEGLPTDIGTFDIVSSFSAVHHLTDQNKLNLFRQVKDVLKPGGWFFLIDAMTQMFDDDVFRKGRDRERARTEKRFAEAGMDIRESDDLKALGEGSSGDASHVDRITSVSNHLQWLEQAGFNSVDHIWHLWMEHLIIARS